MVTPVDFHVDDGLLNVWCQPMDVDLMVDGGIGEATLETAILHGANAFVMGAAFFGNAPGAERADFVRRIRQIAAPYDGRDRA